MRTSFHRDEYPDQRRILFIGLAQSTHTHSWIDLLEGSHFNVRLFASSADLPPANWKVKTYVWATNGPPQDPITRESLFARRSLGQFIQKVAAEGRGRPWKPEWLAGDWLGRILREWKPDIVHTFGLDTAQYYLGFHEKLETTETPKWVLQTRGGSDLQLAHLDPEQNAAIARVMRVCDQLLCDNTHNFSIARDMGVSEEQLSMIGTVPGTGGIDVDSLAARATTSPSSRRTILWPKAYECPWSKSLPVLEALKACWEHLQPCKVEMLVGDPETASWFRTLPANIREHCTLQQRVPREDSLRLMASARVMLAPSLVDGVPNTMYEAMASGALPIVSPIESIRSVVAEDTNVLFARNLYSEEIAAALIRAMTDDSLVEQTARRNIELVRRIANREVIRARVVELYDSLAKGRRSARLTKQGA